MINEGQREERRDARLKDMCCGSAGHHRVCLLRAQRGSIVFRCATASHGASVFVASMLLSWNVGTNEIFS